jgi:hypothetical protein
VDALSTLQLLAFTSEANFKESESAMSMRPLNQNHTDEEEEAQEEYPRSWNSPKMSEANSETVYADESRVAESVCEMNYGCNEGGRLVTVNVLDATLSIRVIFSAYRTLWC